MSEKLPCGCEGKCKGHSMSLSKLFEQPDPPEPYLRWIQDYLARFEYPEFTLGKCEEAVTEMKAAFPELEVVRGHALCPPPWNVRGHWWLKTKDGTIVDPTAAQFTAGIFSYEEWHEGDPVELGICRDCGEPIWGDPKTFEGSTDFCDEACANRYMAYLNRGL